MHGYAITDKIKLLTNRKILINSSSLYLLLHKLQKEKILVSVSSLANNRLRVIYSLTPKGQNLIKQKSGEILDFIQSLKPFLKN